MRAEVALLSRNIKISGVMARDCPAQNGNCYGKTEFFDTYGGHIKIIDDFNEVVIQGAELEFMGQTMDKGFYPIHFHMCTNITGKTAIVKHNSIHDTYARAVTVHGTYGASVESPGVQLIGNVAFNILGHAYFLEDGAEMATLLIANLAAAVQTVDNDFRTDLKRPAGFWITNPKTLLIGNVAAGSQGFGIWYTFPQEPVGPSAGLVYQLNEAKFTPLWTFDNNVVHSNELGGLNFDFILSDDSGHVQGCMQYKSLSDPLDKSSDWVKVQMSRLTAYKNRAMNVWLRGGWFEIYQLSSAESMKGIQLARTLAQRMVITKSIFIGKSVGNSEDSSYPDAVTPAELGQILGIVLHDGPTHFDSCWFNGFDTDGSYIAGAIGFAPKKKFHTSVASSVTNMRFGFTDGVGGNRVFDGLIDDSVQGVAEFNGDESATVRDADGSVTRCPYDTNWKGPVQLVKPEANALTERCTFRGNWNMAVCSDTYGKMHIETARNLQSNFDNSGQMRRRRYDNVNAISVEDNGKQHVSEYMLILGSEEFYYEFQYTNEFPEAFHLKALGVDKNLSVVIGICLPEGVTVDDFRLSGKTPDDISFGKMDRDPSFKLVDSFEELVSDKSMGKMYLSDRMLYLRISSKKVRNEHWDRHDTDHCAGDFCPKVNIRMEWEMAYTTCFDVTEAQLSNTNVLGTIEEHDCVLPASEPDIDWGAGDTLNPKNGNWGEWSSWSDCCNEEGNGTIARTRYRLCDDPAPLYSGTDCEGESAEVTTCPFSCAVDGTFTNWSAWSECFCDGLAEGSDGVRESFRECIGTANGGEFCEGQLTKYAPCMRKRRKCDSRTAEAVDGVLSEWGVWTDCFCGGLAAGSRGAMTRSRTCNGTTHAGLFCKASLDTVKPCDDDCFSQH